MNIDRYETEYIKGFNEGYLITKHLPDVAKGVAIVKSLSPRINGLKEGHREFILEKLQEKLRWNTKQSDRDKGLDKEMDKDYEPEI